MKRLIVIPVTVVLLRFPRLETMMDRDMVGDTRDLFQTTLKRKLLFSMR